MALGGPVVLKRRRFDDSGVSEVVGTILVLLITVIIFSSIIVWVYSIPTPR
ncbi:MAG: type IV pilin, partial [Thermoplasmata archaeon]